MTTTLQTFTSSLKVARPRAAAAARRSFRRGAARQIASFTANGTGVAGFSHLPQTMPPRTR